jgi:flagella basal body P-ring formation protein FlgA
MKKICFILAVLAGVAIAEDASPQIKIYLPRGVEVQSGPLTLGEICIIRCEDEKILHKASAVPMGRGPFFKESLSLSRTTILARLGATGIDTAGVVFSGAQAITLESKDQALAPDQLVLAAQDFLIKKKPLPEDRVWRLVHPPVAVTVSDSHGVELKPRLAARQNPRDDQAGVEVALCRQDKELAVAELTFRADYLVQQAVAVKDIPAHAKLTEEHFKVQIVTVENKPSGEWTSPLGMEATQAIEKGKTIGPGQVKMPTLEIIVRRDQKVKMMIEGLGFRISGIGQALDNGRPGDVVRVLNMDSQQTVACRVAADGTVHPLYDEVKK